MSIRILIVTTDSEICGTERMILSLLQHLDRNRFAPHLVTLMGPGDLTREAARLEIPAWNLNLKKKYDLPGSRPWWKIVSTTQPQIIHSYLHYSNLLARVTRLFHRNLAVISGIRTVYSPEAYGRLYGWWERGTHRWDTFFVANSEMGKRSVLEAMRLPPRKIVVIHNGVEIDVFPQSPMTLRQAARSEFGFQDDHLVIGIVAQLRPSKRHDLLIRAIARLRPRFPALRLLIVGHGNIEGALQNLARQEGIASETIFAGYRDDARRLLPGLDLFALPSVVEGEPVSVLEAMEAALPVVAAQAGGIPELVQDGVTGILAPPNDLDGFCLALERLISDSALRQRLGNAGRERVRTLFSAQRMTEEFQQLYQAAIASLTPTSNQPVPSR